jgi:NhaA family Na+:H+ antiporter
MLHSEYTPLLQGTISFVIPFGNGDKIDFLHFTAFLHKPVGFFILPYLPWPIQQLLLVQYRRNPFATLQHWNSVGTNCWKTIRYLSFSFLAVSAGLCKLQLNLENGHWRRIFWVELGLMSIFITLLAFDDKTIISNAKSLFYFPR